MLERIREEMTRRRDEIARKRVIGDKLAFLRSDLNAVRRKERELRAELVAKRLEHEDKRDSRIIALAGFFTRLFDRKARRRLAEIRALSRKRRQHCREMGSFRETIRILEREYEPLVGAEEAYAELFREKKACLLGLNGDEARAILSREEAMAKSAVKVGELSDVIEAGKAVLWALGDAMHSLDSSREWGRYDILGGGMITSLTKHYHIECANQAAERADQALQRLKKSLADGRILSDTFVGHVHILADTCIKANGLLGITDIIFDNLISDLLMRDRIVQSQENTKRTYDYLDGIVERLRRLKFDEECAQRRLQREIEETIADA